MLTSTLFSENGNHIRWKSKETDEMCCMHWQKITERRFCFCTTRQFYSGAIWRYDPPARVNVLFRKWSYNVSKSCNMSSCFKSSSAKSNVHHSSHSDYVVSRRLSVCVCLSLLNLSFVCCWLSGMAVVLACAVYGLLHDCCNPQMQ